MDHTPAITPAGHPLDDEGELTKLHPGYAHALRLRTTLTALGQELAAPLPKNSPRSRRASRAC